MFNSAVIKSDFGSTLKKIRLQKKLSQEAIADKTGLHRTYISDVERGDRNISLVNISKICLALNVSPSFFFSEIEQRENNNES